MGDNVLVSEDISFTSENFNFSIFSNSISLILEKCELEDNTSFGFADDIWFCRFVCEIPVGTRCATQSELIIPRYEITNSLVLSNNKLITDFSGNWFRNEENLLTFSSNSKKVNF